MLREKRIANLDAFPRRTDLEKFRLSAVKSLRLAGTSDDDTLRVRRRYDVAASQPKKT
jgi:hypothetical protein